MPQSLTWNKNPQTPAHVRKVLNDIQSFSDVAVDDLQAQITANDIDIADIYSQLATLGGGSSVTVSFVESASAGQPVFIDGSGDARLASSAYADAVGILGLAAEAVTAPASGDVQLAGALEVADWTAIVGAANLVPGAQYHLTTTDGKLSTTLTDGTDETLTVLGTAATTKKLAIHPEPPIVLEII